MKYSVGLIAAMAAIGCNAQAFADLPECGVRLQYSIPGPIIVRASNGACIAESLCPGHARQGQRLELRLRRRGLPLPEP